MADKQIPLRVRSITIQIDDQGNKSGSIHVERDLFYANGEKANPEARGVNLSKEDLQGLEVDKLIAGVVALSQDRI